MGGGGQTRGEGAGRRGGSEPDQSSVCNNRSVEADDRLRQSASQAEWALQPGLSTSTTTAEEKAAGGKGGSPALGGFKVGAAPSAGGSQFKDNPTHFLSCFYVLLHQCNAECCVEHCTAGFCCLFQMDRKSLLAGNKSKFEGKKR